MSPLRGPTAEQLRYLAAREVIERARQRAGLNLPPYSRQEWDRDRRLERESSRRKRYLRENEKARDELFESGARETDKRCHITGSMDIVARGR